MSDIKALEARLLKEYPGLELFVYEYDHEINLGEIRLPKELRGQGIGTKIIKELQRYAQEAGKPIVLTPSPEPRKKAALLKFYRSLGFVPNRGRWMDYRLSSPTKPTMYWKPELEEDTPPGGKIVVFQRELVRQHPGLHLEMYEDNEKISIIRIRFSVGLLKRNISPVVIDKIKRYATEAGKSVVLSVPREMAFQQNFLLQYTRLGFGSGRDPRRLYWHPRTISRPGVEELEPQPEPTGAVVGHHGTSASFQNLVGDRSEFHPAQLGMWFSLDREAAKEFARQSRKSRDESFEVVTARILLKNPKVYETYQDFISDWRAGGLHGGLRSRLVRVGHDGIRIRRPYPRFRVDYIVFDRSRIEVMKRDKFEFRESFLSGVESIPAMRNPVEAILSGADINSVLLEAAPTGKAKEWIDNALDVLIWATGSPQWEKEYKSRTDEWRNLIQSAFHLSEVIDIDKADTAKGRWTRSHDAVLFDFAVEGEPYTIHFLKEPGRESWEVVYVRRELLRTRTGIAGPVLREVVAAVKQFVDDHRGKLHSLVFVTSVPVVERVYSLIVRRAAKELGFRWKQGVGNTGGVKFTIYIEGDG